MNTRVLVAFAASLSLAALPLQAEETRTYIPLVSPFCEQNFDRCATHGNVAGYTVGDYLAHPSASYLTLEQFRQMNGYGPEINEDTLLVDEFVARI